jgi:tetratricopeptide (TPR) repeat protein
MTDQTQPADESDDNRTNESAPVSECRRSARTAYRYAAAIIEQAQISQDYGRIDEAIAYLQRATDEAMAERAPEGFDYLWAWEGALSLRLAIDPKGQTADQILGMASILDGWFDASDRRDAMHHAVVAGAFLNRFQRTGERSDLESAIARWKRALEWRPEVSAIEGPWLREIRGVWRESQQAAEVALAGLATTGMLEYDIPGGEHDPFDLYLRAFGYLNRYTMGGPDSDIEISIELLSRAIMLADPPGIDPEAVPDVESAMVDEFDLKILLARAYCARYNRSRSAADLDLALRAYELALQSSRGPAEEQVDRYTGEIAGFIFAPLEALKVSASDLERARRFLAVIGESRFVGIRTKSLSLSNLSSVLQRTALAERNEADAAEALEYARRGAEEIADDDPAHGFALGILASSLSLHFELSGDENAIDEAAAVSEAALAATPPNDPTRPRRIFQSAQLWREAGRIEGNLDHLDRADEILGMLDESAVPEALAEHSFRTMQVGLDRYAVTQESSDVGRAIEAGRQSLAVFAPSFGLRREAIMTLCAALEQRAMASGRVEDLDEVLEISRPVLEAAPERGDELGMLIHSLRAQICRRRYEITGRPDALEEAIRYGRAALNLCTTPANLAVVFDGLQHNLRSRFLRDGDLGDIDLGVELANEIAERFVDSGSSCRLFLDCASLYRIAFDRTARSEELQNSIRYATKAVEIADSASEIAYEGEVMLNELTNMLAERGGAAK